MLLQQTKPTIAILTLGGTIAMTGENGGNVIPTQSADALLTAVPGLSVYANFHTEQVVQKASCALTPQDIRLLAERIKSLCADGIQGIVITQGTDAIEETAFLLDLLIEPCVPVIITGAMRNPSQPGCDGPANLLAAVQAALMNDLTDCGVVVLFDSELHSARHVLKSDAVRGAAFSSPFLGPIGRVVEGRILIQSSLPPLLRPTVPEVSVNPSAKIHLHTASIGDQPGTLLRLCDQNCDGLIVAGMGGGHISPDLCDDLSVLADRMPVVLSSRIPGGQVLAQTYGYPGGEIDLRSRGLISAGWLHPLKARLYLNCLISARADLSGIRAGFEQFDGG